MQTELIEGRYVNLRVANESDAQFTLECRQNKSKTQYIPQLDISLEQQKKWIANQIMSDDCYFFVIERKNGQKIGTFSLYDIHDKSAESGRLVLLGNQIESLETGVLFFTFAFDQLKLCNIRAEIDENNYAALGFSNHFGGEVVAKEYNEKTKSFYLIYDETEAGFNKVREKLLSLIDRFSKRM